MRFPGKRKSKHYFPVSDRGRIPFNYDFSRKGSVYILGIDQLLVDIEASVPEEFLPSHGFSKGESIILDYDKGESVLQELKEKKWITGQYAGGAIGNTLHNFSILSDCESILLGVINKTMTVGDNAYKYICNTSCLVDMAYLQPCEGSMGKALCLITPDGERSFGICKGQANELHPNSIPDHLVKGAAMILISAYLLRDQSAPIYESTLKVIRLAKVHQIPVVMSMGTSCLIQEKREFLKEFIKENVNVLAMNQEEAFTLTEMQDPLLAGEAALDLADLVLITVGMNGLYLCGHVEESLARLTHDKLHTKSIVNYNRFEYSRSMLKKNCSRPLKIYTHINPYMGGPGVITNTNGAGDAALAALLHDMSANVYHKDMVPKSPKHTAFYLSYSSLAQISKYANRVSFEVLRQKSPRLLRGLPEKEDSLEETYWEK